MWMLLGRFSDPRFFETPSDLVQSGPIVEAVTVVSGDDATMLRSFAYLTLNSSIFIFYF
jgi:hypothetical protein